MKNSYDIHIEGLVQGIGFRPFVCQIARRLHLTGFVDNRNDGAHISLQGTPAEKENFIRTLLREKPEMAEIKKIDVHICCPAADYADFTIVASRSTGHRVTRISPDIAVCQACMDDIRRQPHRVGYPFVNCTHCGPRFSITQALPYDRGSTTMSAFPMCATCGREYHDPADRRFHAQPVACNDCGPHYRLLGEGDRTRTDDEVIAAMADVITEGGIVALKGLGGYNLLCRWDCCESVERMRTIKNRYKKPLAVLFRDADTAARYLYISPSERDLLTSWRRPIVLLGERQKQNDALNPGLTRLGAVLPYLPVHHLLFDLLTTDAVVLTSGNLGAEPIIIDDREAERKLRPLVNLLVQHNRDIHNRVDDSVVQVLASGQQQVIRRSRGYAPEPLDLPCSAEGIWALGGEMINTFAVGKENQLMMSQYIGDLKDRQTAAFGREALDRFGRLFRCDPLCVVCDLHPDYVSTQLAESISRSARIPLYQIQHHFAHAAAVMAEKQIVGETVLAVCLDGAGYGDDGYSWGGEFLLCSPVDYKRLSHLPYVPLPGGDRAAVEPWRMAVAYLETTGVPVCHWPETFVSRIGESKIRQIRQLVVKRVQAPLSSSTGRLFDAFASLLGLCDVNSYEAEAALRLEHAADERCCEAYLFDATAPLRMSVLFHQVLADRQGGVALPCIAARIHNTLADRFAAEAAALARQNNVEKVVFSGGVFQNRLLTSRMVNRLERQGLTVLLPGTVPCNDGGISAGQLYIVANRIQSNYYA